MLETKKNIAIKYFLLAVGLLMVNGIAQLYAQTVNPGKITLNQDNRISSLVQKHIKLNSKLLGVMDGYRIQIFFDSGNDSKKRGLDFRSEFLSRYPEVSAYLSFQEPFYKVRVGDFRIKLEADGFLEKIHGDYPNAFTVRDRISFPKLEGE